jgi:hypothetical protein
MVKLITNQWVEKETKMNNNELAQRMLDWAEIKKKLDQKETIIRAAVLELGNQKAAEDFLEPGSNAYEAAVEERTKTTITIDWRGICKDENIAQADIPLTIGVPSVAIKIVKHKG